ncbi:phenylalanine--tRNA ligase subunit beta [Granulibacter bethesdensis]|uniref:Phenylalanine--tRNA ligase beta subunit n=1 Tax=Granulibacter bethesdensis (strain ATCC BAA-1260 / CGDNIH1) TaxID=391165 RepID=Q0BRZ8_GRABC|nr:phenylalanine--tRNA ligase subunit beta [Granulibacter bethesdensis]ABI62404.1 Phenylalanyl-tRNA synthetase beta chain [Granulibacter bethesdensis CGDNIH1]AHJ68667.1 Phenylalanyl-tRNA synthetase beta chain [Granulibacter bethesdensis]APH52237.1 Phenylalanyl-tRNA synthetase beta chain [Granulibacter bethesdensis]APH64930.1 Phenylalanyl-tRNA synthetase beta chain [Granulibacter bethesdensis]
MKFTLSWLKDHLDTDASLSRIAETLTVIGLELEGIEDRAAALTGFNIARIVSAEQHPNADRLRVCQVETGTERGTIQVVCGAPNARAGIGVVLATPGAVVPTNGMVIKEGEIRSVASMGMMCSARELGLGDEHDGIIELSPDLPLGTPYAALAGLDDPVIEISVTPNRGDALGVRGIARDLAAAGLGRLKPFQPVPVAASASSAIHWAIEDREACPFILGRTIRGVRNGPSPDWLAARLKAIGLRPINTLVDITNYVCFDLGRPLHVFDVARVQGDTLTVRRGAGESFRTLNGKDITVTAEDCVIADATGVESLAGITGGERTGCTETTTDVFIECALFDPVRIARSGRYHQISTDARQRFERGVDQALLPAALEAATAMILSLCGGEASAITSAGVEPSWQRDATLRFARLEQLGGLAVPPDEAVGALERLGFGILSRNAEHVTVSVPSWRNDMAVRSPLDLPSTCDAARAATLAEAAAEAEPEAELIEEVLRLRGMDAIPACSLPVDHAVPAASLSPRQTRAALARRELAASGLMECVTFSFVAHEVAARFGGTEESLRLLNPIASDLDQLRPTPVATLALALARNAARGLPEAALFEVGPAFSANGQSQVAAAILGGMTPRHWLEPARSLDAMDAKGYLFSLLSALGVPMDSLSVTADAPGWYHPGRSGVVRQGPKTVLGTFGELHPALIEAMDLPSPTIAFELFLEAVPEPKRRRRAAPTLPPFQPLTRDFAFLAQRGTSADALLRAIRGADRTLITRVSLFDVYDGDKLPEGMISLGVEVTLQPLERSLTDAEIEAISAKIVAAAGKAVGATLR